MHSSYHGSSSGAAPPRRPPRRWKSSSTTGSEMFSSLDDISEMEVFRPRAPLRTKSCEELDAELLLDDDDNNDNGAIPTSIDLSQLAQNLHSIQLQNDMLWDEQDDEDLDDNDNNNNDDHCRRGQNLKPTSSFLSVGSNMTAAQQREPGRFVTPASSFYNATTNAAPMELTCQGVQPVERVTVDPYQFMTSDMSFRLPLVGSLTDSNFIVSKKAKLNQDHNDDDDDDLKKPFGRKTIQLDDMDKEMAAAMPTISLDMDDETQDPTRQQESSSSSAPPPKPIMFGKIKRESRRLVRPNLPF